MAELLSWHKAGQKVTCVVGGKSWGYAGGYFDGPALDEITTIVHVDCCRDEVFLGFAEYLHQSPKPAFLSSCFRPVYPTIIEQLRKLDAPINDREVERV